MDEMVNGRSYEEKRCSVGLQSKISGNVMPAEGETARRVSLQSDLGGRGDERVERLVE